MAIEHDCLENSKVIETRTKDAGKVRTRRCLACKNQWQTIEIAKKSYDSAIYRLEEAAKILNYVTE